jgi:hypothetical protein
MPKLITQNIKLILGFVGVLLIAVSTTFHFAFLKVEIDHLLAEIGALLLVLGFLHVMFELRLREGMLKQVSAAVLGNERLHESRLADCLTNSREVKDPGHWEAANSLIVGLQYSPRFIEDFHSVIEKRAAAKKYTTILLMEENSAAARYLKESKTGIADVVGGVSRIRQLVDEAAKGKARYILIKTHDRVLRYSFIRTEESIWIKFYTNSNARVTVPALKVRVGTPLYNFFDADIKRLGGSQ